MTLTAIETEYKGHRFRSRTEARWAVFFDAIGITWDYEKDGYDLGAEGKYLPDFWLPKSRVHAEVKGQEFTVREVNLCRLLAQRSAHPVVMLPGTPEAKDYLAEMPNGLLGSHMWAVDPDILSLAADRARAARFEHGETPSQERISPYAELRRGTRREQHGERGASAERELIRTMWASRERVVEIAKVVKPESFRDEGYRRIYEALLASDPLDDPMLPPDIAALMDDINNEGAGQMDVDRTVQDSLATLRARELDARCAELDRIIPLADGAEKDRLISEKEALRQELNATGKKYYRKFRRTEVR